MTDDSLPPSFSPGTDASSSSCFRPTSVYQVHRTTLLSYYSLMADASLPPSFSTMTDA